MKFIVLLCLMQCEETAVGVATVDVAASVLHAIKPPSNALDDIHKKFEVKLHGMERT